MDRKCFDQQLDILLKKAEEKIPNENLPDLPFMELAPDVHDWYMFEHEIWEIGEEIKEAEHSNHRYYYTIQNNRQNV